MFFWVNHKQSQYRFTAVHWPVLTNPPDVWRLTIYNLLVFISVYTSHYFTAQTVKQKLLLIQTSRWRRYKSSISTWIRTNWKANNTLEWTISPEWYFPGLPEESALPFPHLTCQQTRLRTCCESKCLFDNNWSNIDLQPENSAETPAGHPEPLIV